MPEFDLFLSHASEDKQTFVLPLAEELDRRGISVWLDRQQLTLGDVLSEKIDEGLARARFGVVVLSHDFFGKQWPRRELDGLVSRETVDGRKVILPIWHGLTAGDVLRYSPTLAAKFAADSHEGITAVADHIHAALRAASNEPPTSSQTNPMPSADNPREFVATDERRPSRDEPLGQVWLVPDTGSELSDVQSLLPLEPAKLPWRVRRAGRVKAG